MSIQDTISGWGKKKAACEDNTKADEVVDTPANKVGDPEFKPKQKEDKVLTVKKVDPAKDRIDGIAKESSWAEIVKQAEAYEEDEDEVEDEDPHRNSGIWDYGTGILGGGSLGYIGGTLGGGLLGALGGGLLGGVGGGVYGGAGSAPISAISGSLLGGTAGASLGGMLGGLGGSVAGGIDAYQGRDKEEKDAKKIKKLEKQSSATLDKEASAVKELWFEISSMDKSSAFGDKITVMNDESIFEAATTYLIDKKASEEGLDAKDQELMTKMAKRFGWAVNGLNKLKSKFGGGPKPTKGPGMLAPPSAGPTANPYLGDAFNMSKHMPPTKGPGMLAAPTGAASKTPWWKPASGVGTAVGAGGIGLGAGLGTGYFGGRGTGRSQGMELGYDLGVQQGDNALKNMDWWSLLKQMFTGSGFGKEHLQNAAQMRGALVKDPNAIFDKYYKS